jgi:hypothetical protein
LTIFASSLLEKPPRKNENNGDDVSDDTKTSAPNAKATHFGGRVGARPFVVFSFFSSSYSSSFPFLRVQRTIKRRRDAMSNATRKKTKNEDMVAVAEEGVLNTASSLLLSAEKVLFVLFVGVVGIREIFLRMFVEVFAQS